MGRSQESCPSSFYDHLIFRFLYSTTVISSLIHFFLVQTLKKISNEENRKCLNALCLIIVYSSNEVLEERNIGRLMGVKGMKRTERMQRFRPEKVIWNGKKKDFRA